RPDLDFEITQRPLLMLGEGPDLLLREADIGERALRDLAHEPVDFRLFQPEARGRPPIESGRQLAHRLVATLRDVGEDALDGLSHLEVGGVRLGPIDPALQKGSHLVLRLLPAKRRSAVSHERAATSKCTSPRCEGKGYSRALAQYWHSMTPPHLGKFRTMFIQQPPGCYGYPNPSWRAHMKAR